MNPPPPLSPQADAPTLSGTKIQGTHMDKLIEEAIEAVDGRFRGWEASPLMHGYARAVARAILPIAFEAAAKIAEERSPAKHYRMDELTEYGQARAEMAANIAKDIRTEALKMEQGK